MPELPNSNVELEIWKDVPNHPFYQVSSFGNFKTLDRVVFNRNRTYIRPSKILKQTIDTSGYLQVKFRSNFIDKRYMAHRIVAAVFHPNDEHLPFVNHKDGNPKNNHYTNLEWCTHQQNIDHAVKTGLMKKGQYLPYSKLVLDTATGIFYESITEAAIARNIPNRTLHHYLSGTRKNKTDFILV